MSLRSFQSYWKMNNVQKYILLIRMHNLKYDQDKSSHFFLHLYLLYFLTYPFYQLIVEGRGQK